MSNVMDVTTSGSSSHRRYRPRSRAKTACEIVGPIGGAVTTAQDSPRLLPLETEQWTTHRRALEATIWGIPIVSMDAMRQSFFRDAGGSYGDMLFWSKPSDWKNRVTTPNASSHYAYFNFNLRDGPLVLEFPAAVGAGLFGTLLDAWQRPLIDVGIQGEGQGGGKYLLLPPGFKGTLPAELLPVWSDTYNGYAVLRAIPNTCAESDIAAAIALIKQMRFYPLACSADPPGCRFIDMSGKVFGGIVRYDESFFASLARMVNEEPVQPRDLAVMGEVRALGIEKGKSFMPSPAVRATLSSAADEARIGFMQRLMWGEPWWPDSHWELPEALGPKTAFTLQTNDQLDVDARGLICFLTCAPPTKFGAATFHLVGMQDADGETLQGTGIYKLHVPADVPAQQFWAVTAYDIETALFIRESPRVGIDSYDFDLRRNDDGSVDVYFSSTPPANQESNWVYTAGKSWFAMFRFYGPEKALLQKTWKLPDFVRVA